MGEQETYTSNFRSIEIDGILGASKAALQDRPEFVYKIVCMLFHASWAVDEIIEADIPDWQKVIVDAEGRILAGIMIDGSLFIAETQGT